ncbi:hypothetical protein RCL1_002715 [Eukaryota sp. TZLM3-RCL]
MSIPPLSLSSVTSFTCSPAPEGHFVKNREFYSTKDFSWNNTSLLSPLSSRIINNPHNDEVFLNSIAHKILDEQIAACEERQRLLDRRDSIRATFSSRKQSRLDLEKKSGITSPKSPISPSSFHHLPSSPGSSRACTRHQVCRCPSEVSHLLNQPSSVPRLPLGSSLHSSSKVCTPTHSPATLSPQQISYNTARLSTLSSPTVRSNHSFLIQTAHELASPKEFSYIDSDELRTKFDRTARRLQSQNTSRKKAQFDAEVVYSRKEIDKFDHAYCLDD